MRSKYIKDNKHHQHHHSKPPMPANRRSGPAMPPRNHAPRPAMPPIPPQMARMQRKPANLAKPIQHLKDNEQVQLASSEKKRASSIVAMVVIVSALIIVATGLEFIKIEVPFLPSFMKVDFSIFPEFIATVFFGPIVGIVAVLLKNVFHMLIFYALNGVVSYAGELSNLITDSVFILIAFSIYLSVAGRLPIINQTKPRRIFGVLISGTGSALATAIIMLPVMNLLIFPMFERFYASYGIEFDILSYYAEKIPNIETLWQGLVNYNLPWEFGKLFLVTIIATIVYAISTINE